MITPWTLIQYTGSISMAYFWYKLYKCDKKYVGDLMYDKGRTLSSTMKFVPMWDNLVEPFIIREFGVLFYAGDSFIKGLVADNDDQEQVKENLTNLYEDINKITEKSE